MNNLELRLLFKDLWFYSRIYYKNDITDFNIEKGTFKAKNHAAATVFDVTISIILVKPYRTFNNTDTIQKR